MSGKGIIHCKQRKRNKNLKSNKIIKKPETKQSTRKLGIFLAGDVFATKQPWNVASLTTCLHDESCRMKKQTIGCGLSDDNEKLKNDFNPI